MICAKGAKGKNGPMFQMPENLFDASLRRYAALNRLIVDLAHSNLRFGFELRRVKTLNDVLALQAAYWQSVVKTLYGLELPVAAAAPAATAHRNGKATEDHAQPQVAEAVPSHPVIATAPTVQETPAKVVVLKRPDRPAPPRQAGDSAAPAATKTKQPPAEKQKRSAATRASTVAKKAEKSPAQRQPQQPPSRRAKATPQKRAARPAAEAPARRPDIRFGRLDDSAVRFTSQEAWRLQGGKWRRIAVEKVLSEGAVLSKSRFDQLFPKAPPLPAGAFSSGSK
jgi:hypothetical protein